MKLLTDLYACQIDDSVQVTFTPEGEELDRSSSLYLSRSNGLLVSIEAFKGNVALGIYEMLTNSIVRECELLNGYVESMDENFPNEIVEGYQKNEDEISFRHHIFKFGENNITLHLTLLLNFTEKDIDDMREVLSNTQIHRKIEVEGSVGDVLSTQILEIEKYSKVGKTFVRNKD
jgi:hypothetical protein